MTIDLYKVSIIIPVYNVELYLEKCLNSVLKQKNINYEVILVDDGSQDNSPQICDRYEDKYQNVSVIHKKNEGLGYARNSGLEIAQGDYILFVDSDDWIVEDSLSILVKKIENSNAEIVCFDSIRTNDVSYSFNKKDTSEDQIVDNKELMKRYLDDKISSTACAKLFKSDLFEKVRFTDICLHEDAYIMHLIFENVKRAVVSIPPHLSEAYQYLHMSKGSFPISEAYADTVLSIPMYTGMIQEEQDYVIESINAF